VNGAVAVAPSLYRVVRFPHLLFCRFCSHRADLSLIVSETHARTQESHLVTGFTFLLF
jgi:hypothetical protein